MLRASRERGWVKRFCLLILLLAFGCKSPGYNIGSSGVTYVTRDPSGFTKSQEVKGADPSTFVVLEGAFAKDKAKVFYHGVELSGANPDTFKIIADEYYSSDGQLVFAGRSLISRDAKGFTLLDKGYSRDTEQVFYLSKKVPGAEATSFEVIEGAGSFSRDAHGVYREGKVISGADGTTFERLNYYYSRDQKHVFIQQEVLEGADAETFYTEPKRQLGKDSKHAYYLDFKLEKLDGSKTQFLDGLYLKDDQSVYFGNLLIEGADPATFETYTENGTLFAKDKNGRYSGGRLRK